MNTLAKEKLQLTPVNGFKFLPTIVMEEVELYRTNKDKEVHPLVAAVSNFDRSYDFTDDINVWRNANKRKEELLEEIEESTEFSSELKVILKDGLELNGLDSLKAAFPELNKNVGIKTIELSELLDNGGYDENRIQKVLAAFNELTMVFNDTDFNRYGDFLVKTPKANKFTREQLEPYKKIALSSKSHERLAKILRCVSSEDFDYFNEIKSCLAAYVNVGTENSPNYKHQTLVPSSSIHIRKRTDVDLEVDLLVIGSMSHDWNIVVMV